MELPDDVAKVVRSLDPVATVLHGSRAIGRSRPDSDWDLLLLVDDGREAAWLTERLPSGTLDIDLLPLPVSEATMLELVGTGLRHARVVSDTDAGDAAALIARSRELHERPRTIAPHVLREQEGHARRVAARMSAASDDQELFFLHLSTFYGLAVRYWFDRRLRWPEPPPEALESISRGDRPYAALLGVLAGDASPTKKAAAADEVCRRLSVGEA